jgi:hypothetical protein
MTLTPDKIYLLAHDLAFLSSKDAKPILYNCDISIVDVLGGQIPYILESEHNRLVDKLKAEEKLLDHQLEVTKTMLKDYAKKNDELYAEIDKLKTELIALKIEFGI